MTPADICDRAADILLEGGWQRGSLGPLDDPTKPHCMEGAVWCAAGDESAWDVFVAIRAELRDPGPFITAWNDRVASDRRQVVSVLRAAGRRLREGT